MKKVAKKIIRRKLGLFSLQFLLFLIRVIPAKVAILMGRSLGLLWYLCSVRHRKTASKSLETAFGKNKSRAEFKKITKSYFQYMGQAGFELLSVVVNKFMVKEDVRIVGRENLAGALKKGKGVIGVSAHLGNFPLMAIKLKEEGFKVNVMARPMRDKETGDFLWSLCKSIGLRIILSYPRRRAIFDCLKALKNNEVITIQMDQNFGSGGVWVKFFGKLAATPVGPITLALRSGARLVPLFIVKDRLGRDIVFVEKEIDIEEGSCQEETILLNAIKITGIIERWVREYPHLWSWIHKRWKSRPQGPDYQAKFKVQKD